MNWSNFSPAGLLQQYDFLLRGRILATAVTSVTLCCVTQGGVLHLLPSKHRSAHQISTGLGALFQRGRTRSGAVKPPGPSPGQGWGEPQGPDHRYSYYLQTVLSLQNTFQRLFPLDLHIKSMVYTVLSPSTAEETEAQRGEMNSLIPAPKWQI